MWIIFLAALALLTPASVLASPIPTCQALPGDSWGGLFSPPLPEDFPREPNRRLKVIAALPGWIEVNGHIAFTSEDAAKWDPLYDPPASVKVIISRPGGGPENSELYFEQRLYHNAEFMLNIPVEPGVHVVEVFARANPRENVHQGPPDHLFTVKVYGECLAVDAGKCSLCSSSLEPA